MRRLGVGILIGCILLITLCLVLARSRQRRQAAAKEFGSIPSLDIDSIDKSVDPCDNFYEYACGAWLKNNSIPAQIAAWGRREQMFERNDLTLRGMVEKFSANDPSRSPSERRIGDYYSSCMDEEAIERQETKPLWLLMTRIDFMYDKSQLPELLAKLHKSGIAAFFNFGPMIDLRDSTSVIANIDAGTLGLPSSEHYLRTDRRAVELKTAYEQHIANMLRLIGESPDRAADDAIAVVTIETRLATLSGDRLAQVRDLSTTDHRMTLAELQSLSPAGFSWQRYLAAINTPSILSLNVVTPAFVTGMDQLLVATDLKNIQAYLRWRTVHYTASLLPRSFVHENFEFYGRILQGMEQSTPRWRRCLALTYFALGDDLDYSYMMREFHPETKDAALKIVENVKAAFTSDIANIPWMTEDTRKQALDKLVHIEAKIARPGSLLDHSKLQIVRNDVFGNTLRANEFDFGRKLGMIGHAVDRSEWNTKASFPDAHSSIRTNEIVFSASFLQPPLYDPGMDDAVKYGSLGFVVGHELTHAFDESGSQLDAQANLQNWWTANDREEFERREQCFIDQYDDLFKGDHIAPIGKVSLAENTADNGGLRLALMAFVELLGPTAQTPIDGFTPQQRFFLAYGQVHCGNERPEHARLPSWYAPRKFRVNGVVSNMPEFQQAFGCKDNARMVRKPVCRVW